MIIDDFISGKVEAKEFVKWILESKEHMSLLDSLVIPEAKNPLYKLYTGYVDEHGISHRPYCYSAVVSANFSLFNMLTEQHAFDGSLGGNLNLYSLIYRFYILTRQGTPYYDAYDKKYDLYLDAVGEYYEGPEVRAVIEKAVNEAFAIQGKGKQKAFLKDKMKELFHIEGNNRPYWIQGAEWPMGKNSPMQYVSKKKKGEEHLYLFRDVDTGEERTIVQWW